MKATAATTAPTLRASLSRAYNGVTLCQFDVDYYQIDLQAGEALEFVTDFNHQLGDIDLRLLTLDGLTELGASRGVRSDRERIFYRSARQQSLIVEVRALDRAALRYDLTYNLQGPYECLPDVDEGQASNNFRPPPRRSLCPRRCAPNGACAQGMSTGTG